MIADSNRTIKIVGNHYLPPNTVNKQHLKESRTHTTCHWKGEASYCHVKVDGKVNPDAAWYYPNPKDAAGEIRGHVAFWKSVDVTD